MGPAMAALRGLKTLRTIYKEDTSDCQHNRDALKKKRDSTFFLRAFLVQQAYL
jgi:hypothetical protein